MCEATEGMEGTNEGTGSKVLDDRYGQHKKMMNTCEPYSHTNKAEKCPSTSDVDCTTTILLNSPKKLSY